MRRWRRRFEEDGEAGLADRRLGKVSGREVPAEVAGDIAELHRTRPDDVHHLTADQVHARADGWHIAGYPYVVQYGRETPSQDGDYWLFYKAYPDGSFTPIYCFFAPLRAS